MNGTSAAVPPSGGGTARTVEAAYDELFVRHRLSMIRLARLLVDDVASAEDVVQDALMAHCSTRKGGRPSKRNAPRAGTGAGRSRP